MAIGLESLAIEFGAAEVLRNAPTAILYEHAIVREKAAILSSVGWRLIPARRPAAVRSTSGLSITPKARARSGGGTSTSPRATRAFSPAGNRPSITSVPSSLSTSSTVSPGGTRNTASRCG